MIYKWDKKKYVHESNCMLISNCMAYFGVSFYKKKITVSYPAVLVLHFQELKLKKNSVLNWKTNCEVIIND